MGNIWLIADTHFSHKNIVLGESDWPDKEKVCRPFQSVKDHDEFLLNEINKVVKSTDILYHLGDFGLGFAWKDRLPELRSKINCETIRLCLGNHDHLIEKALSDWNIRDKLEDKPNLISDAKKILGLFNQVYYLKFGKVGGQSCCFCHYAMKVWPWQHQGSYHLYGHSHGNLPDDEHSLSLDVGVDTKLYGHKQYTPYSFEEIDHIMQHCKKELIWRDHHKPEELANVKLG